MYHSTYKKWLAITNDEFEKKVSKMINQNECKMFEEIDEHVFGLENQWMGKYF